MVYNLSNVTAATDWWSYFTAINDLSGGFTVGLLLFTLFLVIFIMLKNYDTKVVLVADSFIVTIVSVLFYALGVVSLSILMIPLVLLLISIFILWFGQ